MLATVSGTMLGLLAGLLPGINNTMILLSLFFVLPSFDLTIICAFYIACLVTSQYMGSVTATILAVPGESSSLPALAEGHALHQIGRGWLALWTACWASFVASTIAVVLALIMSPLVSHFVVLSYTEVKALFFMAVFLLLVISSGNAWPWNTALLAMGIAVGQVGFNPYNAETWGTWGNDYLAGGIPKMPVIIFMYAIPLLLSGAGTRLQHCDTIRDDRACTIKNFPVWSTVRGSLIGFVSGLIPNLTYVFSTKFAWVYEKWHWRRTYVQGDHRCLAAAESANNSAVLTSLLPFLIFAVPIQLSEVVLLDIINLSGQHITMAWMTDNVHKLLLAFALANIFAAMFALPLARQTLALVSRHNGVIIPAVIVVMSTTVLLHGHNISQQGYYVVVSSISLLLGLILHRAKVDVTPFIFGLVLSMPVSLVFDVIQQKYFIF